MKRIIVIVAALLVAVVAEAQETVALRAVKALQSATRAGVDLRDYRPRVVDAKIVVDRALGAEASPERRAAIARAMDFHIAAAAAWAARGDRWGELSVEAHPVIRSCPRAADFAVKHQKTIVGGSVVIFGSATLMEAVHVFWSCANEAIAEAEGAPVAGPRDRT